MSRSRIRHRAGVLLLTAVGLAGTLALATPAHAAGATNVSMNGGTLGVVAGAEADDLRLAQPAGNGGDVTIKSFSGTVTAGTGCVPLSSSEAQRQGRRR